MSIYDIFYLTLIAIQQSIVVRIIFVAILFAAYWMCKNPREDFYNDKEDY